MNNWEYGDSISLNMGSETLFAVVTNGKPSFMRRLKLAWRILRGFNFEAAKGKV